MVANQPNGMVCGDPVLHLPADYVRYHGLPNEVGKPRVADQDRAYKASWFCSKTLAYFHTFQNLTDHWAFARDVPFDSSSHFHTCDLPDSFCSPSCNTSIVGEIIAASSVAPAFSRFMNAIPGLQSGWHGASFNDAVQIFSQDSSRSQT